jgi:hypothetical protein
MTRDRQSRRTDSVRSRGCFCSFPEEGRTSTVEGFSETHLTDENAKFVSFRRFAFDGSAVESDGMTIHLGALIGRPGRLTWDTCRKERSCEHVAYGVWRRANRRTYFGGRLQQSWCVLKPQLDALAAIDWLNFLKSAEVS